MLYRLSPRLSALVAAYYMDMIPAVCAFKHAGNKVILDGHSGSADRASSWQMMLKAAYAAPDVHQPVPAPGKGRKSRCFNQISLKHLYGTYRANLRIAGLALEWLIPSPMRPAGIKWGSRPEKQRISKPH
jgi:hypothetical protein